ncbi:hypothetical protein COU19_00570 [Candidatus Kaiserbacteria bacterium CG10_big_fil_rev_8_21_14_0_10_56_12]|uniref:Glycosyltransferase subfamily 4-like N-terminal domain-containing protein n=1 Tax=Candidatus Kaiserbacteria bacterium CG10_big_fil_rev_8_21_14_0_10_56_12 TaxID=1974611 RepID=A0A2H0UAK7_9BACT|nr:MAG: hypothetical protein COU19_00570 [Candidatus Kaiserbacteria bacterium CG10_big_fil_rev_8_21_14_0_10_56_12]
MRVVIATPLYPPQIGGPATYAHLLSTALPSRGIAVHVIAYSEVCALPKYIRHFAYYRRVRRAARQADLILALDPVSVGLPALWAARRQRIPLVLKVGGDYAWEQGQQRFGVTEGLDEFIRTHKVAFPVVILRRVQSYVARGAARIITPSEYLRRVVCTWGVAPANVSVIYNAVAPTKIGHVPEAVDELARPRVVTAGRLVPWKNIDCIIDAVATTRDLTLVVVGDGPERARLEQHARPLRRRVLFTGALSHDDTLATIQTADIFVLNSSYEGLSHLLVEALMLGVPTVATRAGGNEEVLTHDTHGVLVPVGDTAALAAALIAAPPPTTMSNTTFTEEKMVALTIDLLTAL